MASVVSLLAVVALGLSAGAVLAEAAVLVPFWRSLPAESFLRWYRQYGGLLLRFFGPLEAIAALLTVLATIGSWLSSTAATGWLLTASVLSLLVLVAFPLYFQKVNASFADGSIESARVADELRRWARWHWVRTALAGAAFIAAVVAV